jgi:hypothetical protein
MTNKKDLRAALVVVVAPPREGALFFITRWGLATAAAAALAFAVNPARAPHVRAGGAAGVVFAAWAAPSTGGAADWWWFASWRALADLAAEAVAALVGGRRQRAAAVVRVLAAGALLATATHCAVRASWSWGGAAYAVGVLPHAVWSALEAWWWGGGAAPKKDD